MNSLTELNGYVNGLSFEYTDQRYARVIFDRTNADNQSLVVNEGQTFSHPIGIEIVDVVNYSVSTPTLTIDISNVYSNGVRLNWPVTPVGVTITEPEPGKYVVSGIISKGIWDQIKQPNVVLPTNLPNAFFGTFTYTTTINYIDANLGASLKSYTSAISVLDITYLTNPLQFVYETNTVNRILQTPQVPSFLDSTYPGAIWTVTATVSSGIAIDNFSSASTSGGTFTYNSGTKGFTISGTRTQVNAHLNALDLDSNLNEIDFTIFYVLSNNQDTTTDSKTQSLINKNIQYFSNPSEPTTFYIEDTLNSVNGEPQITDITYSGSGNYTVEIYPNDTAAIFTLSSLGTGGTSTFNAVTKKLTIVGTKTQVNEHLQNISLQPESDVDYVFQLFYVLTIPLGAGSTKIQEFVCNSNDTEVSNILVSRNYIANRANSIFASNTPQIIDFDNTGVNTYTITLTCSFGRFGVAESSPVNPYSFTGTKSQVNSHISTIKFYPNKDVASTGLINYTQIKNGVTQVNQNFSVIGSSGTYQGARSLTFTATQNFTPTVEDVIYGRWAGFLVGAGGGGGAAAGGGGGGGEGIYVSNQTLSSFGTFLVTVGAGGGGGTGSSTNGGDGGNTIFAGVTARGGKGGKGPVSGRGGDGGESGDGSPGGLGVVGGVDSEAAGGGGGGCGDFEGFYPSLPTAVTPGGPNTGNGFNATFSGGLARGGSGGSRWWFYTDKNGVLIGPTLEYNGGGGGGGAGPAGARGSTESGRGEGANNTNAAEDGGNPGTITAQFAGQGGGGGAQNVNQNGGRGADGIIAIEFY